MPDMKMVEVRPEQVDELAALAKPIYDRKIPVRTGHARADGA